MLVEFYPTTTIVTTNIRENKKKIALENIDITII